MAWKGQIKTRAIVVRGIDYSESDRIITVLSEDAGRMTLLARRARKPGNPFSAVSQFLCYSEFILNQGRDFPVIHAADVLESFSGISLDMGRFMCASHCAELALEIVRENQPCENTLRLLLNALYLLSRGLREPEFIARVFEIRCMSEAGYEPVLNECAACGREVCSEPYIFLAGKGGLACKECAGICKEGIPLSSGAVKAIYHASRARLESVFSFRMSAGVSGELKRLGSVYLPRHLGKEFVLFSGNEG
ncbi:MAG TPA: DNA repair protein RecO [Clostridiales bacterium]|nr:DNA repair protein RecO [Clostridiales bacterium]